MTTKKYSAEDFTNAALDDAVAANEILAASPELREADLYPALVLGNAAKLGALLETTPRLAMEKGGPRNWEPLLYVCFSRFAAAQESGDHARTARLLLQHGANPNASYEYSPGNPLSALYGAAGLNNNAVLARVLLEAGATPDDSESLYHSTEHEDLTCFRLLLEFGASTHRTNALKHMLDREEAEGVRLLLAAGADPDESNERGETALHWAVWRGRSPSIIAMLLEKGANINAKRKDGRMPYAVAIVNGLAKTAKFLEARGADTALLPFDRFVSACHAGNLESIQTFLQASGTMDGPELQRLLPDLAMNRRTEAIRTLLQLGVPVSGRGEHGGTALHWACWKGYDELVELLLQHGASVTTEDETFHATPVGWLDHGRQACREPSGDYARVAHLLREAGATVPEPDRK